VKDSDIFSYKKVKSICSTDQQTISRFHHFSLVSGITYLQVPNDLPFLHSRVAQQQQALRRPDGWRLQRGILPQHTRTLADDPPRTSSPNCDSTRLSSGSAARAPPPTATPWSSSGPTRASHHRSARRQCSGLASRCTSSSVCQSFGEYHHVHTQGGLAPPSAHGQARACGSSRADTPNWARALAASLAWSSSCRCHPCLAPP